MRAALAAGRTPARREGVPVALVLLAALDEAPLARRVAGQVRGRTRHALHAPAVHLGPRRQPGHREARAGPAVAQASHAVARVPVVVQPAREARVAGAPDVSAAPLAVPAPVARLHLQLGPRSRQPDRHHPAGPVQEEGDSVLPVPRVALVELRLSFGLRRLRGLKVREAPLQAQVRLRQVRPRGPRHRSDGAGPDIRQRVP
uniref:Putative secreted protein n=1 Tax=Ixodes ricinus TaxID=34613 RepID=A0A6B0V169_IXORI